MKVLVLGLTGLVLMLAAVTLVYLPAAMFLAGVCLLRGAVLLDRPTPVRSAEA